MKLTTLFILNIVIASTLFSQNDANKFNLSGIVTGQDSGHVYIKYFKTINEIVIDSCLLLNGHFQFSGYIDAPRKLSFYQKTKSNSIDTPNWVEIFVEPGSITASLKEGEFKNAEIKGSRSQSEYRVYLNRLESLEGKWKNVFEEWDQAIIKKDTSALDKIHNERLPIYTEEVRNMSRTYVRDFPNSAISPFLFALDHSLGLDSLKYYFSLLTPTVQKSFYGEIIGRSIARQEKLQIGGLAPDFSKPDLNGNTISLKKFAGQYVLLEFWASWCIPCREEHPHLKKAYRKYHDKGFEIIAFSLDRLEEKDKWITVIKNDSLPWIQICDFKELASGVVQDYDLSGRGIPANFLLGPKGEIVGKNLRGDELEKKLEQLIN